jgi:hypothetical protein
MQAVARDRDARRGLRVIMFGLSQITSAQGMEPHREQEAPVPCVHEVPAARNALAGFALKRVPFPKTLGAGPRTTRFR